MCLGPNVDFMLEANNLFTLAIQIEYERNEWADVDPRVALAINAIAFELCEHLIQCNAKLEAPIVEAEARLLKFQTDAFNDYQRILSTEWEKDDSDEAARPAVWTFAELQRAYGSQLAQYMYLGQRGYMYDSGSESPDFELTGSQTAAERTEANRIRAEQEGDVLDLATDDEASAPPKPDSDDDECAVVSTLGG